MHVYCYNLKVKNIRQQSTLHEGHRGNVMIAKFSLSHCLLPKVTASLRHHEINKTIIIIKVKVRVTQSALCNPVDWLSLSVGIPGKNTGVGSHSLFQGNLLTQRSNLPLLHCRQILYRLSHQGSPITLKMNSKSDGYTHFLF